MRLRDARIPYVCKAHAPAAKGPPLWQGSNAQAYA
jgi:hypothetical protein